LSLRSFSYCNSLSSLAESSWSTSPAGALLNCDVEKADVNCDDRRGAHNEDLRRELWRATEGCLRAAELRRETVRGAERANALIDIILESVGILNVVYKEVIQCTRMECWDGYLKILVVMKLATDSSHFKLPNFFGGSSETWAG
ncbi:hypothetical protein, partial [Erythrobacter sp. YJ-T3-07]|uniref:hypothetical protein n=1 Tax=Erythrobacter sp. YJ-T3-07 TaxID=2793063 RepID=UPI001F20EA26